MTTKRRTAAPKTRSLGIADSVLVACPEPGCLAFPFGSLVECDAHVASGAHVFEADLYRHGRDHRADAEGITNRGDSVDRPDGTGTGTGSGRRPGPAPYTWAKVGEVWAVRVPVGTHASGETVTVTKKSGGSSDVTLGRHLSSDDRFDVFAAGTAAGSVPSSYRWAKVAGEWVVRGPEKNDPIGQTITVEKADGSTAQAVIVAQVAAGTYRVEKKAQAASTGEAPEGIHGFDGSIFRVQTSKAGRRYALRLVGTSFEYEAGAIRNLSTETLLSLDEAKRYGRETGVCCSCGRTLTDPKSIEAGIGPICESKF